MPNKRVDIFDSTKNSTLNIAKNDALDKILQNLTPSTNDNSKAQDEPVRQPTIVDEYLEILKMRREVARTLFKMHLIPMLNERDNVDPSHIEKVASLIGLYLGIGDRWSNEVLKNAIANEMGIFGGFTTKLYPEYLGDPIANYERSVSIGTKDDTSVLLANLLQLLGINVSPELVDKLAKLFKEKFNTK